MAATAPAEDEPAAAPGQQSARSPWRDPPFLAELAHYEWVELALMVAEETIDLDSIDPNGIISPGRYGIWPAHMRGRRG